MVALTKTTKPLRTEDVQRKWHLIDLNGKILGRAVTEISKYLIGKHKPTYSAHTDNGDYVVIINAKDVKYTGRKGEQKVYTRYSGYPGGLKKLTLTKLMEKDSTKVIKNAVAGMLPKNRLQDKRMTRLFIYANENHPYKEKFGENN